jgi:hypothetical protein
VPWSGGVYTRSNGVFQGATVWAQDAAVPVNIIATRHDTHDQDIATGLNNCVTIDGLNPPSTNFPAKVDNSYSLGTPSFRWQTALLSGSLNLYNGATNLVQVAAGTLTASRTANFPDASGNVVIDTATQTLTNKTLTSPIITGFGVQAGQCRLSVASTTSLLLSPYQGCAIWINGQTYQIPSAGIAATSTSTYVGGVAAQALAASTLYYVYLFVNSGTLTLDFWTTTHLTDTTAGNVGVEVRSNGGSPDSTRSLVGMIATDASAHFVDSQTSRTVLNWFNRQNKIFIGANTNGATTASTSFAELSSSARVLTLNWQDDGIFIALNGTGQNQDGSHQAAANVGLDSTSAGTATDTEVQPGAFYATMSSSTARLPTEGSLHTLTPLGKSITSGTSAFFLTINGYVRG